MTGDPRAARFRTLMDAMLASNAFYRDKYHDAGVIARATPTLDDLAALPLTIKEELVTDQAAHPPYGRNLTRPLAEYTRVHQTSGTMGRPLRWLDTAESWAWWLRCWGVVYEAAGVTGADRVFVAFSFGPFIGFWAAFDALAGIGAMAIPGGGLSSSQRLRTILEHEATVVVCTPTYALRLGEEARTAGIDLAASSVRVTIHAGEPGASIPNVRDRIAATWAARCVDHPGATEVGAWGFSCGVADHVHVNESEFVAEIVGDDGRPVALDDGVADGELVLTNLGRVGSPVIRYRTGDLVSADRAPCACGRTSLVLRGGVRGRRDGMMIVRGINVFPSAIENIIREWPEIDEFEVRLPREREMAALVIAIESRDGERVAGELAAAVHDRLGVRPNVVVAPDRSLPRYELKARRFKVD